LFCQVSSAVLPRRWQRRFDGGTGPSDSPITDGSAMQMRFSPPSSMTRHEICAIAASASLKEGPAKSCQSSVASSPPAPPGSRCR
jgi:hypothetical protein